MNNLEPVNKCRRKDCNKQVFDGKLGLCLQCKIDWVQVIGE